MKRLLIISLAAVLVLGLSIVPLSAKPALATNGGVILHPGDLTGSVTVTGQNITQVTVRAMDTAGVFSASVTVNVPSGASSIDYTLTVEGDRDYYVIAEAQVVATDYTRVILPVHGPVNVPIGGTVTQNLSVDPAFISGTISTTTNSGNTIQAFQIYARINVPEFSMYFHNRAIASGLSVPGQPGRDYTLLVAPGLQYQFYAYITVNGIQYNFPVETVPALAAGEILDRDFTIDVTAASISGTALLQGTTTYVYSASVRGYAYNPYRNASTVIADIATGVYTLDVDADTWNVHPYFYFYLTPSNLNGLYGSLRPPATAVTLAAGDHLTQDFLIDPGFITGTFSLSGANTDIASGSIRGYSTPSGYMSASIHPDTGEYMFVASPGDWQYQGFSLSFDYPGDPDTYLRSNLYQSGYILSPYTVASGDTLSGIDLTYGTATVRLYYYVEGGGELRSPYYYARRAESPHLYSYAYGSPYLTTEGQTIGTLFPGTYTIEAFANVGGSVTEFGTFTVSVDEGDVVVIGGPARPTIKVTNPTDGEVIPAASVTVEGTATDNEGIASITINGEAVTFTSTGNPDDPNEVAFSHEVSLPVVGENTITVVATDVDPTPHSVTLELTVIRTEVTTATTLTYTGDTLVPVNTPATLAAMLEDADGPISGAEISFQVDSQICSAVTGTDGVASCEMTLSAAGVYEVTAEFAGDDLHQSSTASAFLTVYNPEGGFVTGGGWIDSPEGAYAAEPTLTGRANFGFVSKYHKGATTPTGQTEFQFKVADLNFHSDTYQWLVVAGARAQYKGTGTINGEGNYGFMLTAIDEKLTPSTDVDMFRIKIWDKDNDAIVYDNQIGDDDDAGPITGIAGGNIVIHKN